MREPLAEVAVTGAPSADHRPDGRSRTATGSGGAERLDLVVPAPHAGVMADTAVRIGLAVTLGLLQPDERLPSEGELATTFGVSRMTTRRALDLLAERGVLVRRRGRGGGTFVASEPPRQALDEFGARRAVSGEVYDLIDHRMVIECGAAYLAAGRASDADLDRLRALVGEMDAARTWTEFRAIDPRFHLAVAAIAGPPGVVRSLADVLARLFRFYVPYPIRFLHASNREHEALVAALAARNADEAAAIAGRHIADLRETVFVSPDTQPGRRATARG